MTDENLKWHEQAREIGWAALESIQEAYDAFRALEDGAETASYDGEDFDDAETVTERVQEQPLSIEVRSDWHAPGGDNAPAEFNVLLGTGGPAVRIVGRLTEHAEPERPRVEVQDWFKPWTEVHASQFDDALDWFVSQFYFGE